MGAPVVIRQRAADINSGVNSRDECRNATSPVGTAEGNIIGSIVVGALVAWRLLVPMLSLDYIYHLRCHPNSPVPYGGPSFIPCCRIEGESPSASLRVPVTCLKRYKYYNFVLVLVPSASLARSIICRVSIAAAARQRLNSSWLSLRLVIVHRMWSSPIE